MAVAAPADKRFRRAHVKPARRRTVAWRTVWRVTRAVVVVALVFYGGWRAAGIVNDAQALQVRQVSVRGNERLSTGEVLALVDGMRGENILGVDLDRWRERLLSSPWVLDAKLRRVLPSRVEVAIEERRPMGIGRLGQALYLVDHRGVIVDEYGPAYADIDLPIIDGLASAPSEGGSLVDERRAALAGRLLADLGARDDLLAQVSQLDVSDAYDAVVILEGDTARLRLGDRDFAERLEDYLELAPALRERVADIDYVDLRFGERLYVRPREVASARTVPAVRQ
ncbi:MAG: cell division protein FtsQ/DivIB [Vicinamibacteria bacterium]